MGQNLMRGRISIECPAWEQAIEQLGIDRTFYTHRRRKIDEVFPWEHIDVALTRRFLTQDFLMSQQEETRIDCRDQCFACGILPKLKDLRRQTVPDAWECPPVTSIAERKARQKAKTLIPVSEVLPNRG